MQAAYKVEVRQNKTKQNPPAKGEVVDKNAKKSMQENADKCGRKELS